MNLRKNLSGNIVAIFIVIIVIFFAVQFFDFNNLQTKILSAGIWAPIILILLKASTIVFAPLSGAPLYPIAGAIFGFWGGLLYIVLGDLIGTTIAFWISRLLGQKVVEKMLQKKNMHVAEKIVKTIETTGGFLFARICFAPMPEIIAYASGLTKIKFWKFFVINFIVGVIPAAILVWGGDALTFFKNPWIMMIFIVFGTLVVILGTYIFYKFAKLNE